MPPLPVPTRLRRSASRRVHPVMRCTMGVSGRRCRGLHGVIAAGVGEGGHGGGAHHCLRWTEVVKKWLADDHQELGRTFRAISVNRQVSLIAPLIAQAIPPDREDPRPQAAVHAPVQRRKPLASPLSMASWWIISATGPGPAIAASSASLASFAAAHHEPATSHCAWRCFAEKSTPAWFLT